MQKKKEKKIEQKRCRNNINHNMISKRSYVIWSVILSVDRIGGVMVSVLVASSVKCRIKTQSCHTRL